MDEVGRIKLAERDKFDPLRIRAVISRLAARQRGVISRIQLIGLGLTPASIGRLLRSGYLHPIHHGVYAVGHPHVSREGLWVAALLAVGPPVYLSHFVAAEILGLIDDAGSRIDVTTTNRGGRCRGGIVIHRVRSLGTADVDRRKGLPITSASRVLLDLSAVAGRRTVERAAEQSYNEGLFDPSSLYALLSRSQGRKGAATLRAITDSHTIGTTFTRSELEEEFQSYAKRHDLEAPVCNKPLVLHDRTIYPDAMWPDQRVVLERDSRQFHSSLPAQRRARIPRPSRSCGMRYCAARSPCLPQRA